MLACAARAHLYQRLAEEALRRASLLCDPGARHLLKRRKGANRAGFAFPLTGSPHQAEIITLVDSSSVMSSVPGRADASSRSQLSPGLPALPQEPRIRMHGALLPGSGHPSASKAVCAEVLAEGGSEHLCKQQQDRSTGYGQTGCLSCPSSPETDSGF